MNSKQKDAFAQAAILGVIFLGLPLLIRDTGSGMIVLLIAMPLLCIGFSCLSAWRNGFQWHVPLMAAGWFLVSISLFYNATALPYTAAFFLLGCLGQALGVALRRR